MQKLFRKLFLIGCTVILVAYLYYRYSYKIISFSEGSTTRQQIYQSVENARNKNYELVFLGNSRIYRGINPDKFSLAAYNFAHDNDSYNQCYYKLRYLTEDLHKQIHYVVLGVDYFSFSYLSDTRNYIYGELFPREYLMNYDTVHSYLDYKNRLNNKFNEFLTLNYSNTFFVFLSSLKNKLKNNQPANLPVLKNSGQFIKPGMASVTDKSLNHYKILPIQKCYFEKLVSLCKINSIKLLLLMPPSRNEELANFSEKEKLEFNSWMQNMIDSNMVFYKNYSVDSNFSMKDFTDITHLNEAAADRFSTMVNRDLRKLFFQQ